MSPFDAPPSSPPVSIEPPRRPHSRRRTALIALASAGLVGGGLVAVGQFASADEPSIASGSFGAQPTTAAPVTTEPDTAESTATTAAPSDDGEPGSDTPVIDGEIVIDVGDGEPLTIDLGELADADFEAFGECLGLPAMWTGELPDIGAMGEMPMPSIDDFSELDDLFGGLPGMAPGNGHVTVAGPDGLSAVEFGEGDGSVTVTRSNGELTVTSEGDVEVKDLDAMFDELPTIEWGEAGEPIDGSVPALPDADKLQECLDIATGS